jgi:hypothetical protein
MLPKVLRQSWTNKDAYKALQKYNDVNYGPYSTEDNWYYWSNMWLNGA